MNILFLGPECPRLEQHLHRLGHRLHRVESPLPPGFLPAFSGEAAFDFGLSYRYQHILSRDSIAYFAGKLLNMHSALLPWNRGRDPNLWSFLEDTPKGVTIHRINAGVDTGDILLQRELHFDETTATLRTTYAALSDGIERLFLDNAEALLNDALPGRPQPAGGSSHKGTDKTPWLPLIEKLWWDTPVRELVGKARQPRNCNTSGI